jgi:formate C-acetyltransferase
VTVTTSVPTRTDITDPWREFRGSAWRDSVDVADFIRANVRPYTGDSVFLSGLTDRTTALWQQLSLMFTEERRRGVHDVDAATPSTITSHEPGYIDRPNELIVGLQTDAPLRRAIMPNGGYRMVENGLRAYGYVPDRRVTEIITTYRKTHNDGVFDAYTPQILAARKAGSSPGCRTPTAVAASSATTGG